MPRASRPKVASSTSTPLKRALSPSKATPTRRSKRVKSSPIHPVAKVAGKSTPKKSQFFEQKPGLDQNSEPSEAESAVEEEASGYEDEDEEFSSAVSSPAESEDDADEYNSAEEAPRKRNSRGRKPANGNGVATTSKLVKGQELWRPGVKTGLAPGEAMFIRLPKAREAGDTPYTDDTVHPNTMAFLGDLKENNDREWLKGKLSLTILMYKNGVS